MTGWPVLSAITWLPFVAAVLIMFTARHRPLLVRWLSVVSTGLCLVLSIAIYVAYDREAAGFQFYEELALVPPLGIKYQVAVDGMSLLMVLLTSIIIFAGSFASWTVRERSQEFYALLSSSSPVSTASSCRSTSSCSFSSTRSPCCRCTS